MRATARGEFDIIQLLLDDGRYINEEAWAPQDEEEATSHITGFGLGVYGRAVLRLLQNRFRPRGGHTALMDAVTLGHVNIVEHLMEKGCAVDIRNNEDKTAMDLARLFREDEIVTLLRGSGAASPKLAIRTGG